MIEFLIALVLIITLHELAHLIVAKLCGCRVIEFSIGFGKALFSKKIGGTTYKVAPLLLGGYNKLKGELKCSKDKDAFTSLTYRKKLAIALAGVIVNIVTGYIALLLGRHFHIYFLRYFGILSIIIGVTNALPIPALDGSYPFLLAIEKIIPKKYALKLMRTLCKWGFIILMILNIASIPWLIYLLMKGVL